MVTLTNDQLQFNFPEQEGGARARVGVDFQRTLRIPDDGREHYLPPGLGRFPLRHIEDYELGRLEHRKRRGGVIMPMFQADALWLNFDIRGPLPVALKIGAGKVNAVSGKPWKPGLSGEPQDYVVVPGQPWLDGFNTGKGVIRQFVAMPLGEGYTVEEQIDPDSDVGGIQIEAFPMKRRVYRRLFERGVFESPRLEEADGVVYSPAPAKQEMGLGMGGEMRQEIYEDEYGVNAWSTRRAQRCFIMLANAKQWMAITGEEPPLSPISAEEYIRAGLPWYDHYDGDREAIEGARALGKIKSIRQIERRRRRGAPIFSFGKNVEDGEW